MSKGYLRIPRSLLEHSFVRSCPDACFRLLITILENMAYEPCLQDDHGVSIQLQPGEMICTYRQLADLTGIKKTTVERYVSSFFNVKILGHKVGHVKTIISVLHADTRALFYKDVSEKMGQEVGQKWDKNGTQKKNKRTKEHKENNNNKEENVADAPVVDFSKLEKLNFSKASIDSIKKTFAKEKLDQSRFDIAFSHISSNSAQKSPPAYFLWAARSLDENENIIDPSANKRHAMAISETYRSSDCRIDIFEKCVEIISSNGQICYVAIPYESKGFKNNLQKHLLERNFKQINEKYA